MAGQGDRAGLPRRRLPGAALPGRRDLRRAPHRTRVREPGPRAAAGDNPRAPDLGPAGISSAWRPGALDVQSRGEEAKTLPRRQVVAEHDLLQLGVPERIQVEVPRQVAAQAAVSVLDRALRMLP